jgi:flavin reductase (DIM6/NTAB) family NADH-FMN oxidoreductase RutF
MCDSRRSRVLIRFCVLGGRAAIEPGYKHAGINFHKEFVVHYPSAQQGAIAWFCGTRSGRDTDKIKEANLSLINSVAVQVPTIEGVTVAFECGVVGQFEIGAIRYLWEKSLRYAVSCRGLSTYMSCRIRIL